MSVPFSSATDFADDVVQRIHDQHCWWFGAIEPEWQQAAEVAYRDVQQVFADHPQLMLIHEMQERYFSLAMLLYSAGVRHGAAAEQFRMALSTPIATRMGAVS